METMIFRDTHERQQRWVVGAFTYQSSGSQFYESKMIWSEEI